MTTSGTNSEPVALSISVELVEGRAAVNVYIAGEIDMSNVAVVSRAIDDAAAMAPHVRLDLAHVSFIDCSGVRTLLLAKNRLKELGGEFSILALSHRVERLLELTGTSEELTS